MLKFEIQDANLLGDLHATDTPIKIDHIISSPMRNLGNSGKMTLHTSTPHWDILTYLERVGVRDRIGEQLSRGIPKGSIVLVAPRDAEVALAKSAAKFVPDSTIIQTGGADGVTRFPATLGSFAQGRNLFFIGTEYLGEGEMSALVNALADQGLTLKEARFVINANPAIAKQLPIPVQSLALVNGIEQMFDEASLPAWLREEPISVNRGYGAQLTQKPGQPELPYSRLAERLRIEDEVGCTFADLCKAVKMDVDQIILVPNERVST